MKKIILTALAVLMVLAFAGCSGDLHDVGLLDGGWYVAGNITSPNEWTPNTYPVVSVSSTEWYFDFTAKASTGAFKVCPGAWDGAYGCSATITAGGAPVAMEIGAGDASISGLTDGSKYRITFTQNPEDFKLYASVKAL